MTQGKILLAIEAVSGLDEMAYAAEAHGYKLRVLAEDPHYYGDTRAEIKEFPTRDTNRLQDYVAQHRSAIAQVFSLTDTWGLAASKLRDKFGFYQFSNTSKLEFFRDKKKVQAKLISLGFARHSEAWPKILKPRDGTGKTGLHLVDSEAALNAVLVKSNLCSADYLAQDFYLGPMYSAELWCDANDEMFFGITNRILSDPPFFLERVKSFPWAPDTEWENQVKAWVIRLLRELDYDLGLVHVEFAETATGFELIEINPRMAGSMITPGIALTTNFNPFAMAVDQAIGAGPCLTQEREIKSGYSHVSLYASCTGTIASIHGLENLSRYPGEL